MGRTSSACRGPSRSRTDGSGRRVRADRPQPQPTVLPVVLVGQRLSVSSSSGREEETPHRLREGPMGDTNLQRVRFRANGVSPARSGGSGDPARSRCGPHRTPRRGRSLAPSRPSPRRGTGSAPPPQQLAPVAALVASGAVHRLRCRGVPLTGQCPDDLHAGQIQPPQPLSGTRIWAYGLNKRPYQPAPGHIVGAGDRVAPDPPHVARSQHERFSPRWTTGTPAPGCSREA